MEKWFYISSAVTVITIVFFYMFRERIAALIDRITSIGKTGITTSVPQRTGSSEHNPRDEADLLIRELDNALIREVEEGYRQKLRERTLSGDEALRVTIKYLAVAYITLDFESLYYRIYGSQIALLTWLNTQTQGQPTDALRPFYTLAANQYQAIYSGYTFEAWLGFLRSSLLVREDAGCVRITVKGREFLSHLVRMGHITNKTG